MATQPSQMVTWRLRQLGQHCLCSRWQCPSWAAAWAQPPMLPTEVHWGTSPWNRRGAPACARLSLRCGSCPSQDRRAAAPPTFPVETSLSLAGLASLLCHPALARVLSPPAAMFLPQALLAFVQLMETKVPVMPSGVAWFRHWLPQGHGTQGQPLWQVFAKPQGDLHFCLSFYQLGPLPAQWNLAWPGQRQDQT